METSNGAKLSGVRNMILLSIALKRLTGTILLAATPIPMRFPLWVLTPIHS